MVLQLSLRVPPSTIEHVIRDAAGDARLRASARVRSRFGARTFESSQEFTLSAADSALGQGKVVVMRFAVAPGPCQITARMTDLNSKRRGLIYSGREVNESVEIAGTVDVPPPLLNSRHDPSVTWPSSHSPSGPWM